MSDILRNPAILAALPVGAKEFGESPFLLAALPCRESSAPARLVPFVEGS